MVLLYVEVGWYNCFITPWYSRSQVNIIWANYNDVSRGRPKWWFSKGTSQNPLTSGLGIILICPDMPRYNVLNLFCHIISLFNCWLKTTHCQCRIWMYLTIAGFRSQISSRQKRGQKTTVDQWIWGFSLNKNPWSNDVKRGVVKESI